ncbi:MAG: hypothetical protein WC260_04095 [Candidatus Pacearchaeota archaeon]
MKIISKRILTFHNKKVYDLNVKDNHNYFISKKDILVHNSGKSYTAKKIRSGSIEARIVNTDKFFPFFKDEWEKWLPIKDRVKKINKDQLVLYINSILPLAVDGTAGDPSLLLRRRGILESFGYDTGMVFVNTSLETALERASKRSRPVNPEFITETYKKIQKLKNFYRSRFDTWIEVDNDSGQLTDDIITDIFKFTAQFYTSPIINPIGRDHKSRMIENGWKYLNPNILKLSEIDQALTGWYKR